MKNPVDELLHPRGKTQSGVHVWVKLDKSIRQKNITLQKNETIVVITIIIIVISILFLIETVIT